MFAFIFGVVFGIAAIAVYEGISGKALNVRPKKGV